ncbi:U4/U6.U5 tri-snRNP-associated protein 1-like [Zophobas morio]|uniref:U4/U6.U5 tri-snRNP-associated protein 1-like n=1 Tax=Zophobas morio TaxID=2755281 RepID=UPI003082D0A1
MLQFKKPKKKRRKLNGDISGAPKKNKLTAEDLLQCSAAVPEPLVDHGSRLRSYRKRDEDKDDESTITKVSLPPDLNGSFKENGNSRAALDLDSKKSAAFQEVLEDARDLETLLALERTKRLKERKVKPLEDQESKLAHALAFRREKDLMVLKKQEKEVTINGESDPLMFSANEEAIRNLGSSGYESHAAKLSKKLRSKEDKSGADEIIVSNEKTDKYALPEETLIKSSVSAALQVAKTIGLLSDLKGGTTTLILDSEQLRQQDELDSRTEREKDRDKYRHRARERALVDREKERERERETLSRRGQPFEEKKDYRPSVELVFKDEHGRILDQKHAFKHLSHRFHGNGPGKNKLEKLLKKEAIEKKLQSVKADDITMNKLKENKNWTKSLCGGRRGWWKHCCCIEHQKTGSV